MRSSYFLHTLETFSLQLARKTRSERSGHEPVLIGLSEVGRDKRQLLMPRQIFHVATIPLMIGSQTNGKHTDRQTTTKWALPLHGL